MEPKRCKVCWTEVKVEPYYNGYRIECSCQADNTYHSLGMWSNDKEELITQWNELME